MAKKTLQSLTSRATHHAKENISKQYKNQPPPPPANYYLLLFYCYFFSFFSSDIGTKHPLVSDESLTIRKKFKESPLTKTANKFKTAVPSRPKKVPWSEEEQAAVKRHLGNFIAMQKLPGKEAIQATLKKERCLQKRNWRNVKDFVRNSITSRARKSGRGLFH